MATGWGRGTWSSDYFGATSVSISVTGNVGTLSLGVETVVAAANVAVTNVVGTTALDNGTAVQAAAVTGVSAVASTSALGDESVTCAANVAVTGNVGTSALGTESLITNNFLNMTGLAGTSALGTVKNQNGEYYGFRVHGYIASNTAVNYVKVYASGGANLDKGTVTLYGIAK